MARTSFLVVILMLVFVGPWARAETLRDHLGTGSNAEVNISRSVAPASSLTQDLRRFFDDPSQFLQKEGQAFLDRIRKDHPDAADKVEKCLTEYVRVRDAFGDGCF